ncbi:MAG TPA: response regulator [Candidatus Nitrosotenuis sp.]|nr:response regulator [Candidatus Nitrosotenuis sp.]
MTAERFYILVVDDDPSIRSLCLRSLNSLPRVTVTVAQAETALKLIREADAAVVDLLLPGASGLAVLEAALEAGTPALVITGLDREHPLVAEALRRGFSLLPKPFGPRELLDALRRLVPQLMEGEQPGGEETLPGVS